MRKDPIAVTASAGRVVYKAENEVRMTLLDAASVVRHCCFLVVRSGACECLRMLANVCMA